MSTLLQRMLLRARGVDAPTEQRIAPLLPARFAHAASPPFAPLDAIPVQSVPAPGSAESIVSASNSTPAPTGRTPIATPAMVTPAQVASRLTGVELAGSGSRTQSASVESPTTAAHPTQPARDPSEPVRQSGEAMRTHAAPRAAPLSDSVLKAALEKAAPTSVSSRRLEPRHAAHSSATSATRAAAAPQPASSSISPSERAPSITVSIGHIEVRSPAPRPAVRGREFRPRVMLSDFLARRGGHGQ